MNFIKEADELRKTILPCLTLFLIFFLIFFFLPPSNSFSSQLLSKMQKDLLTDKVQLISTNPLNAFLAQLSTALFLSFVFGLGFFLYKGIKYLNPALYKKEKNIMLKVLIPSVLLFGAGCLFAYFFIIPSTFKILYSYTTKIGAAAFFNINEFVSSVLSLMIIVGAIFLLPIFMVLLSRLKIVKTGFWTKNWSYAILFWAVFSAIITPDGTGITMLILSLPAAGLYLTGCILS